MLKNKSCPRAFLQDTADNLKQACLDLKERIYKFETKVILVIG